MNSGGIRMILNNVRLVASISGGTATECGHVVIKDGKIASVAARPISDSQLEEAAKAGEEIVDGEGRTLIPGLIDAHTHLVGLLGIGTGHGSDGMAVLVDAAAQAPKYLTYGFTTIRDCGSSFGCANYVRDMVKKGAIIGPDIIACGPTMGVSSYHKKGMEEGIHNFYDGEDSFRKGVREHIADGADFIKIYASGSAANPKGVPMYPTMTRAEIDAVTDAANSNGLYVAAHCHADKAIRDCAESGVYTIEHATYLSEETADYINSKEDCYIVPTLAAMYVSQEDPVERAFWLARLTPMLEATARTLGYAYRGNPKMGFGTDSAAGSKQYEFGVEFQFRKDYCKMKDEDILLQATRYSAEILGIDKRVGAIKEGLNADLCLIDGKPDIDISCMYHRPYKVWKGGKLVAVNK